MNRQFTQRQVKKKSSGAGQFVHQNVLFHQFHPLLFKYQLGGLLVPIQIATQIMVLLASCLLGGLLLDSLDLPPAGIFVCGPPCRNKLRVYLLIAP